MKAVQRTRPGGAPRSRSLTSYAGLHALWLHRWRTSCTRSSVPVVCRAGSASSTACITGIEIHPGAEDRQGPVHRSRHGRGDRRDRGDRRQRHALPGCDARRHRQGARQAPPHVGTTWWSAPAPRCWAPSRWATTPRSAPAAWSSRTCRGTRRWSATRAGPCCSRAQRVGIPDIDYRHLPDPVAEAISRLVARIVEMEKELDEIHPERNGERSRPCARRRRCWPSCGLQRGRRHLTRGRRPAPASGARLAGPS